MPIEKSHEEEEKRIRMVATGNYNGEKEGLHCRECEGRREGRHWVGGPGRMYCKSICKSMN
ncbi:hypothetical protein TIFTF001_028586 [Ficus carica]|uniref:Uncharacterized protein n=1 Tax=Ficus carica TaxID=3494 RepID=A0AA88DQ23_FICCA|nr:hypothetical protein TIFTF001_028586 [Ficus carica]